MSEAPELSEAEAFAAEHALGVLSGPERAQAEARMVRDPDFAAAVEAWRERLAPLLDGVAEVAPGAHVWPRIARSLPANDDARAVRFWRSAAAGAGALAGASLAVAVVVANRPPAVVQAPAAAPAALISASLASPSGGRPLFVAAYDPARQALIVTSMAAADAAHVHELWVIPADGKPRALGFIAPGASKALPMPAPVRGFLRAGSAIAVSVEPPGGSTRPDGPSGPIAAVGKLSAI